MGCDALRALLVTSNHLSYAGLNAWISHRSAIPRGAQDTYRQLATHLKPKAGGLGRTLRVLDVEEAHQLSTQESDSKAEVREGIDTRGRTPLPDSDRGAVGNVGAQRKPRVKRDASVCPFARGGRPDKS